MGLVAHRDHQRESAAHVRQMFGDVVTEIETGSARRCDRSRMNPLGRTRPCRLRCTGVGRTPDGGGQLATSGVAGAHEQHPTGTASPTVQRKERRERVVDELDVAPSTVSGRGDASNEIGSLEYSEVMGDEVGVETETLDEITRRQIGESQQVDDSQAGGIAEGGEGGGSFLDVHEEKNMCQ